MNTKIAASMQTLYGRMIHAIFVVCSKLIFAWLVLFIHHLMAAFFPNILAGFLFDVSFWSEPNTSNVLIRFAYFA